MQNFGIVQIGYTLGSLLVVSIIGMLWRYRAAIVSIVSGIRAHAHAEGAARKAYRQQVYGDAIMSRRVAVPVSPKRLMERRSYAAELPTERTGTQSGNIIPGVVEILGTASDDQLLDILARVTDEDGNLKYADSRIAKFIGGRLEDRIAQVRLVRGVDATPKPKVAAYVTPIVGRPTSARFEQGDPDYPFEPCRS